VSSPEIANHEPEEAQNHRRVTASVDDNRFGPARGVTDELKGGARLAG
jgi:hypothetical protein